jgi:protein NEDD1
MLAAVTADGLVLCRPAALKAPPAALPPAHTFARAPTAAAWSPAHTALFVADAGSVARFTPQGALADTVYDEPAGDAIAHIVVPDDDTVLFGAGSRLRLYDTKRRAVVHDIDAHPSALTGLALSHDRSLAASTSASTALVHDLRHAPPSLTALGALPASGAPLSACVFHPHTRTRLLLAAGRDLVVYDTARPAAPLRTIAAPGDIVGVSCSPFSKTLVALACSNATVCLADLEKERG